MNLLSDEKIETLWQEHVLPGFGNQQKFISPTVFARAIEAAVLEAQGKQEPVAWAYTINNSHSVFSAEKPPEDAYDEGTLYPLYAAPVVQPDMVMVPREPTEAMLDAAMNRYQHVSPEAKARYTQMHRENFRCDYRAMIAACEDKS